MPLTINRTEEATHGSYQAELPGAARPAVLTWRARDEARVIEHTFVPPEMRGRGIAQQLVEAIVADAREQGFRIVPQCSYAEVLFRRRADWTDVLAD
jgi:uncharacterized protein